MNIKIWLIVNEKGSVRTTKGKPPLKWNEIAMLLSIDVPKEIFVRPVVSAKIVIDKKHGQPEQIDVDVLPEVENILREKGINIKLEAVHPDCFGDYNEDHPERNCLKCNVGFKCSENTAKTE